MEPWLRGASLRLIDQDSFPLGPDHWRRTAGRRRVRRHRRPLAGAVGPGRGDQGSAAARPAGRLFPAGRGIR
ncbi:hypothetical protein ACRAWD_01280 [Caulobacter segnis]